jgi:polyisoprenoid-binding protein YceI
MDSEKFPTATFKGELTNLSKVNFSKNGTYPVTVKGELTIHGVTKPVETAGAIVVSGKTINATTDFSIKLEDYGISGGPIEAGKVAREPKISVAAEF